MCIFYHEPIIIDMVVDGCRRYHKVAQVEDELVGMSVTIAITVTIIVSITITVAMHLEVAQVEDELVGAQPRRARVQHLNRKVNG